MVFNSSDLIPSVSSITVSYVVSRNDVRGTYYAVDAYALVCYGISQKMISSWITEIRENVHHYANSISMPYEMVFDNGVIVRPIYFDSDRINVICRQGVAWRVLELNAKIEV